MREDLIKQNGVITNVFKGDNFQVKIEESGHLALCKPSGSIRKNQIKLLVGDSVIVELSPYDLSRGRIVFRELNTNKIERK